MSLLTRFKAEELGVLAVILAIIISDDQSADELDLLGNFIAAVGTIILVISSQKGILKAQQEQQASEDAMQQLKARIEELEAAIK
ncbi:MAG: hypothetical protein ACRDBM_10450 [Sporomusa sp.]